MLFCMCFGRHAVPVVDQSPINFYLLPQNLWVHVGDDDTGSLTENSTNPLCSYLGGGRERTNHTSILCEEPLHGKYLDLRTRRPDDLPEQFLFSLEISAIQLHFFEGGKFMLTHTGIKQQYDEHIPNTV